MTPWCSENQRIPQPCLEKRLVTGRFFLRPECSITNDKTRIYHTGNSRKQEYQFKGIHDAGDLTKHGDITASDPCNMWSIIKEVNNGRCLQPAMPPVNNKVYIMLHTFSHLKWIVHRYFLAR